MKKEIIKQLFEQMRCNEQIIYGFDYDLGVIHNEVFKGDKTVYYRETHDLFMTYEEMLDIVKDFDKVFEKFNGKTGMTVYLNENTRTLLLVNTNVYKKQPKKSILVKANNFMSLISLFPNNKIEKPTHVDKFAIASNGPVFSTRLYQNILSKGRSLAEFKDSLTPKENNIFVINKGRDGFFLDHYDLEPSDNFRDIIESNYNDNFKAAYNDLINFLGDQMPGLVLFTGKPGTGKSSLIQHLIYMADNLDKRFVILPASFIDILADPDFTNFAVEKLNDAILCIEDAEDVLADRNLGQNASVKNILNITDGILGKVMRTKVLCTVNNETSIDKALLRKGRLKLKYRFEPLNPEKATKLSAMLGINKIYTEPATLADIYNEEQVVTYEKPMKKIGFGNN
jgi:hypothetical protein